MGRPLSCEEESLVEYFIVATKRFDGSAAELSFVYPPLDDDPEETEFCENVTMFTFPHGYVHSWDGRSLPPPPAHNLFTLTDMQGDHLYGASISFFETSNHVKSLCVLTRRPFYTQMLRYLEQLLLLGLHQARRGQGDAVEKALCNLFHEVPVPYRGLSVQMQVGELEIHLERPPFLDFPFEGDIELMLYAFMMIDPKVLQQLYHHVLLEHRVLIVGNDSVLVTAVVETLKALIFPLTWLHVVIPNIPDSLDLSTLLDAPVPFLAGAHTGQLQHVAIPSNVVKYDLTESRLIVPSASNNYQQYQQDLESVVLPTLPEVSTRLLQKLSTTRVADLHTQKRELQQRLWDRRIQLQKCCMATSTVTTNRAPVITPKAFFLVKQSLVHKKMMKLYLDVITSFLQDFPMNFSMQYEQSEVDKFVTRKPSNTRAFYKAFTDTAHFQSFISQNAEYTAGLLPLEEEVKFQYVHKTLLSTERVTGNQADASLAVTMALTKTFVALAPQIVDADPANDGSEPEIKAQLELVFPSVNLEAFGEPRQILFPSMSTDAVHSSLGTFISPSGVASRRASKDTSDWMQSFMRTMPLPSALLSSTSTLTMSHSNNSSSSNSERSLMSIFESSVAPPRTTESSSSAPLKRTRTIDRLKKASPFYRTMTQKALDSTLSSLASAAVGMTAPPPHTRPSTVVRSIWLITTSSCKCRDRVVLLTQSLVEQLQIHGTKTAPEVAIAYCELIDALGLCNHPSEAKAVFEECLSGSALVSFGPIASMPHFWKPFSALMRCYLINGLVQRAFDVLAQVEIQDEHLLDPSLGVLQFRAKVLDADKESMVERVYVTFACGNLGMRLAPRATPEHPTSSSQGFGCELIAFQNDPDGEDHHQHQGEDGPPRIESLEDTSGLRIHDILETINGEFVMHHPFYEIITALKQATRPMTVTFVRGLDRINILTNTDVGDRRTSSSASFASVSSTSAVIDGRSGIANKTMSSTKITPRRDLCDRFGLLPQHGIRLTALTDCKCCGTQLSLAQVQSNWSTSEASDCKIKCASCGRRFVPRLRIVLGIKSQSTPHAGHKQLPRDLHVEEYEFLSIAILRKELNNLARKVPLHLLPMKDLRELHPRIYWNIVAKLLALDVPLDFMDLPDETRKQTVKEVTTTTVDDQEMRVLRDMVMKRAERVKSENLGQRMEDALSSVLKSLEQQTKEILQAKTKAITTIPGRKRWSLLGSIGTSSSLSLRTPTAPAPPPKAALTRGKNRGDDDKSGHSDDDRETDIEDLRSSRTMSTTESVVYDDLAPMDPSTTKSKPRTKFMMPSLPSAPFQRSTRAFPSAR